MTSISSLLGGVGLFLLGMWLMTDGLKLAAGDALKTILETWTRTPARAFLAGFMITGMVQSSTATTVATVGFVDAGLLSLVQAVWVVVGANVGTTLTGWMVALVGLKISMTAFALPMIGLGMLLRLAVRANSRLAGIGQALAGFGAFFMGLGILQDGFSGVGPGIEALGIATPSALTMLAFLGFGLALTLITQSSSASIAIVLSAASTGGVPLLLAASAVIGINIGTTSTAALSAIGATPPARRVAASHVVFNVGTGAVALVLVQPLLMLSGFIAGIVGDGRSEPLIIDDYHTLFSLLGTLLMVFLSRRLVTWLEGRFTSDAEKIGRPQYLDDTLLQVPSVALQGLVRELQRMLELAFVFTRRSLAGPAPTDETGAGLHQLAREARRFVSRMGSEQLPAKVADALPDLIRATQNIDDMVTASASLARAAYPADSATPDDWRELLAAVTDCLAAPASAGPPDGSPQTLRGKLARLDAAFDELKRRLLRDAAIGRMRIEDMGMQLTNAEACKTVGGLAIRARQRLAPWTLDED